MAHADRRGRRTCLRQVIVQRLPLIAAAGLLLAMFASAQDAPQSPREYLKQMDANGDGRISEAEYVVYMSRGFYSMDTDGDGALDASELPGGRGKPITLREFQTNLRRQFHRLDRNHDGYLSPKELAQPPG